MAEGDVARKSRDEHPVLIGLLALVSVAVLIGIVVGVATLYGTRALGLGDSDSTSADSTGQETLSLPSPVPTEEPSGPLVTLAPTPTPTQEEVEPEEPETTKPATPITLTVGQTEVVPLGQIDLSGVYPGGEGAILQVQQFENGDWDDFPVTASVSNETFTTFVQTGQEGLNRFRVMDSDTGVTSNEIKVTVSGG